MPPARSKLLCLAGVVCALAFALFELSRRPTTHPQFGEVFESSMAMRPAFWGQVNVNVRKFFGFPNPGNPTRYLKIGPAPLEWSTGGGIGKGFIYANHPLLNDTPLWEFALSTQASLFAVRRNNLPTEYFGMNDPRGSNVFGSDWRGHALLVPAGQVLFARLVTNRTAVYVIHLLEQGSGRSRGQMRVNYAVVTNVPVAPLGNGYGLLP